MAMEPTRREMIGGVVAAAAMLSLPMLQECACAEDAPATGAAPAAGEDTWVATIKPGDLKDGSFDGSQAVKNKFILSRKGAEVMALDTKCTHKGCAVKVTGAAVICPCHKAAYLTTGEPTKDPRNPAKAALGRYAVRLNADGVIEVNVAKKLPMTDDTTVLKVPAAT